MSKCLLGFPRSESKSQSFPLLWKIRSFSKVKDLSHRDPSYGKVSHRCMIKWQSYSLIWNGTISLLSCGSSKVIYNCILAWMRNGKARDVLMKYCYNDGLNCYWLICCISMRHIICQFYRHGRIYVMLCINYCLEEFISYNLNYDTVFYIEVLIIITYFEDGSRSL